MSQIRIARLFLSGFGLLQGTLITLLLNNAPEHGDRLWGIILGVLCYSSCCFFLWVGTFAGDDLVKSITSDIVEAQPEDWNETVSSRESSRLWSVAEVIAYLAFYGVTYFAVVVGVSLFIDFSEWLWGGAVFVIALVAIAAYRRMIGPKKL